MKVKEFCSKHGFSNTTNLDSVLYNIDKEKDGKQLDKTQQNTQIPQRDLLAEASNIGDIKRYNMLVNQSVNLSGDVKKYLDELRRKNN